MKIINKTPNNLLHTKFENGKAEHYFLGAGKFDNIPDDIAKNWLKIKGVEKYVAPKEHEELQEENKKLKELQKVNEKLKKEHEELQEENKKLKEQLNQNNSSDSQTQESNNQ